jgi:6-phosphogluconolactonase
MRIFKYDNINEMSYNAAKTFYNFYNYYIKKNGLFTVALSGGNTPKLLYQILSSQYKGLINWHNVYIFLGDERYADIKDNNNNFKMINELLLSKINIPKKNIFRPKTEIYPIEKCAEQYEKDIINFFKFIKKEISLDLILLGMGNDGHTASIFPDTPVSDDKYVDITYPKNATPKIPRITFTYKTINNAKNIMFLLSGEKKIKILKEIFEGKFYPTSMVKAKENLLYFISKI